MFYYLLLIGIKGVSVFVELCSRVEATEVGVIVWEARLKIWLCRTLDAWLYLGAAELLLILERWAELARISEFDLSVVVLEIGLDAESLACVKSLGLREVLTWIDVLSCWEILSSW